MRAETWSMTPIWTCKPAVDANLEWYPNLGTQIWGDTPNREREPGVVGSIEKVDLQ
jgi:hypothetical protein